MTDRQPQDSVPARLDALAEEICAHLAGCFPVCMASDEFHFFPHYKAARQDWPRWDDFSDAGVQASLGALSRWQGRIAQRTPPKPSPVEAADLDLLTRVLNTLDEQLRHVQPHKTQPTFHLTIISIGLGEALEESRAALRQRAGTLPR